MDELVTMERLLHLIETNQWMQLQEELSQHNPVDIANLLQELDNDKMVLVFRLLPKDLSADIFAYMDSDQQAHIVSSISNLEVNALVDNLFLDDTVDILEEMPANVVTKILSSTDAQTRRQINMLLQYPDNSAGSIMTIEFVDFRESWNVGQAMAHLRKTAPDSETIHTCYVTDNARKLLVTISMRKLILASDDEPLHELMHDNVISVRTLDDQ